MKRRTLLGIAIAIGLLILLAACVMQVPEGTTPGVVGLGERQQARGFSNVPCYTEQGGARIVCESGGEIELQTGAVFDAQAGSVASFAGGLAITGQVDVGDWINLSAQTSVTVTNGGTITPNGTYQPIVSSGVVTTSATTAVANGAETGDLLILRNANAANNIIIDGAGANVECGGDKTLGPNDTLTLIWNGADWVCIAASDN